MLRSRIIFAGTAISILSGCTTTSFAPPAVQVGYVASRPGTDKCDFSDVAHKKDKPRKIHRDATGALKLVNNFIVTYRCAMRKAADGRQIFEVPSYLAATGGVIALALGAGRDVAIGTGAGASIFGGAKNYYAPKDKAHILNSALDALICIKSEAVGVAAFKDNGDDIKSDEKANLNDSNRAAATYSVDDDEDSVSFPSERRYFEMVAASLFSVERIISERLSSVGRFDPAGIVAEIDMLTQSLAAAKDAKKTEQVDTSGNRTDDVGVAQADIAFETTDVKNASGIQKLAKVFEHNTNLKLNVMQPKLQRCVVRAKL